MKNSHERSENIFSFSSQPNPKSSLPIENDLYPDQNSNYAQPLFLELTDRVRGSMAAMKTLAFYSRENFKDRELGEYFYRVVTEDIEKTISLLDCFYEYLSLNNPVRKENTINIMLGEILKEKQSEFEKKNLRIIKKQFAKDLPETTLNDEQLSFILNSIFGYILFSAPLNGAMGILTRTVESNKWYEEENARLQKDVKYIEILILAKYLNSSHQPKDFPTPVSNEKQKDGMDLILQLVKKTVENHRGAMMTKVSAKKGMNIISVVLPIERRNVFKFVPPPSRPRKD
jgi:nitrogen-specific signal transduction histidine kinase